MDLQRILDALRDGEDLTAHLAEHTDLSGLEGEALAAFATLRQADALTEADLTALESLADAVEAIRGETTRRTESLEATRAKAAALAERISEPATEPETETEPQVDIEPEPEPEPVTAAAPAKRAKVDLAAIARRAPKPQPPASPVGLPAVLTAAADVPGVPTGAGYESWAQLTAAFIRRWEGMGRPGPEPGTAAAAKLRKTSRESFTGVAMLTRPPSEFTSGDGADVAHNTQVITAAANEARLTGGSLLAAGGWCAPSETIYDLCDTGMAADGLLDLPEIRAVRGGIRFTAGPDFCTVFTQDAFWTLTEAQVEASTVKPCFEIPCPTFEECRLDALGFCLTGGILGNLRAYPEITEDWLRKTVIAFAHYRNAYVINQVVAGSDDLGTLASCGAGLGGGATGSILGAIDLQIAAYRERNRLPMGATLELVAPHWVTGLIRADLAQRTGVDMTNVTDAMVGAHFAARGAMLRYVYDWQPLTACTPGPADATAWPTSVSFLLYRAGTWVAAVNDVITIDARFDDSLTSTNRYGVRFQEEGLCILKRCVDSRLFSVEICPTGATTEPEVACVCGS